MLLGRSNGWSFRWALAIFPGQNRHRQQISNPSVACSNHAGSTPDPCFPAWKMRAKSLPRQIRVSFGWSFGWALNEPAHEKSPLGNPRGLTRLGRTSLSRSCPLAGLDHPRRGHIVRLIWRGDGHRHRRHYQPCPSGSPELGRPACRCRAPENLGALDHIPLTLCLHSHHLSPSIGDLPPSRVLWPDLGSGGWRPCVGPPTRDRCQYIQAGTRVNRFVCDFLPAGRRRSGGPRSPPNRARRSGP